MMQNFKPLVIGLDHLVLAVVDISAPRNGIVGRIHSLHIRGPDGNCIEEPN